MPSMPKEVGDALLARRVVVVSGELDHARASELCATLLTLDALGDDHIDLHLHSSSGTFDTGLMLVDVIEALGVPVHTLGMGVVSGGMVGVLTAGDRRALSPYARLHLRQPDIDIAGRATEIERALAERHALRDVFYRFLARRTRRLVSDIEVEWAGSRFLTAEDAHTLGYVTGVATASEHPETDRRGQPEQQ
jgi:ATP-dependent Clp protease, protease subunit